MIQAMLTFFDQAELTTHLEFHLPKQRGEQTRLRTNFPQYLYRQLVCWCLIQRYRYYVLGKPRVTDLQYDRIEAWVAKLEKENDDFQNPYSPTRCVGSDDPADYPHSIRNWFARRAR